ncbi:glycosyltransferase [Psychroserpens sp. XS_ASV72]|uniref:glycosyltransferase n=1 Tax=Psychroserpens sp. XS_ASV72 TaxID=3241293 RepID=UPI003513049D
MVFRKRILVAPLNWGLGHATRCIPLIKALQDLGHEPVIASDGVALALLEKEFPELETIALPSYDIKYAKNGQFFKFKMLQNSPKLVNAIKSERKTVNNIVKDKQIDGIISDNRLGVYNKNVPSVFITHQLKVLSGNTTWLSTKMHQKIIKRFNECWVPDNIGEDNLSGKLGHTEVQGIPVKYIGPLSRFNKTERPLKYDLMVLLSGPEPQRTMLEHVLLDKLKSFDGNIVFVKGKVDGSSEKQTEGQMDIYNYMTSHTLENALNESKFILSRSGYTTVMDLAKLQKKAFFIPTPGQFEQEYLAKRLSKLGHVLSCKQNDFSVDKLANIEDTKGLSSMNYTTNYKKLFSLFQSE